MVDEEDASGARTYIDEVIALSSIILVGLAAVGCIIIAVVASSERQQADRCARAGVDVCMEEAH